MKVILRSLYNFIRLMGFDIRMFLMFWRHFPKYFGQYLKVLRWSNDWPVSRLFPIFSDMYEGAGTASGHYFHQDLYFAQKIFKNGPGTHCDIGSRIDGFVAHILAFRSIVVIDIRKMESKVKGLLFKQADLMNLSEEFYNKYESVSCLHALEHFGLGRYTDPLNPYGYRLGFANLSKMLKNDGVLYFSVPVGRQRIEFNAHRIFSISTILSLAHDNGLELIDFDYVDDNGDFVSVNSIEETKLKRISDHLAYGCGMFTFKKI